MSHHKGPAYYLIRVVISVVLILVGIPLGWVITGFGFQYNIPTPGVYVGACVTRLLPQTGEWGPSVPALLACGLVNSFCCYALIYALFVVAKRLFNSPW